MPFWLKILLYSLAVNLRRWKSDAAVYWVRFVLFGKSMFCSSNWYYGVSDRPFGWVTELQARRSQVVETLYWHDSDRTIALESPHPLTEMSTRDLPWAVKAVGVTTLSPSCADCQKSWKAEPFGALRAWSRAVYEEVFVFTLTDIIHILFKSLSWNWEKGLLASSCLSLCLSAWNISAPTGRIFYEAQCF